MPQLKLPVEGIDPPQESLTVEGNMVHAVSPEGERRSMKVAELLAKLLKPRVDTCSTILPDGVKAVVPIDQGSIYVHQSPPRVYRFRWIADGSPQPFGAGAQYREVRIALPYLVVLAVFEESRGSVPRLGNASEAFFCNEPLDAKGVDTELCYPALLNCSRFPEEAISKPLSWICVQHLPPTERGGGDDAGASVRKGLTALLQHLLESGFNLSSEHHEVSSWYSETVKAGVDPRLATIETWEQASAEDPLFVLEVPWLPTGHTLGQVAERIAKQRERRRSKITTARDLLRVVFQNTKPS